ncbi:MAG: IclR family transcriptional regulator [Hyphomonadaceae bacterium]|nr:IclR family transcriptional regulator [Hyphomonadaceae bacterium]
MDKTLINALHILERLALSDKPQGVTELATALKLSKSSVHRPLTTLMKLGYIHQNEETGRYEASLRMWEIGSSVLARLDLKRAAALPMAKLAAATGETVHLSVLDGSDVIHIDKIECEHAIRAYSRVGGRVPCHCIATGKAMLAFQAAELIASVAKNLKRVTPGTIVDRKQFLAELAQVRRTGIAVSRGGWQEGVDGVAAPIRDVSGAVVAGVGISGPAARLRAHVRARHAPMVADTAANISCALGFKAPQLRPRAAGES